jgi:hypothetical protein
MLSVDFYCYAGCHSAESRGAIQTFTNFRKIQNKNDNQNIFMGEKSSGLLQGILTEKEGSVQLTSSLRLVVLKKTKYIASV